MRHKKLTRFFPFPGRQRTPIGTRAERTDGRINEQANNRFMKAFLFRMALMSLRVAHRITMTCVSWVRPSPMHVCRRTRNCGICLCTRVAEGRQGRCARERERPRAGEPANARAQGREKYRNGLKGNTSASSI